MSKGTGSRGLRRLGKGLPQAVLFDAVGTLIYPYPSVGAVYARAASVSGFPCSPALLNRHFRGAYRELLPERFAGSGERRTGEEMERGWWRKTVARTFEKAGYGTAPPEVVERAFEAFGGGSAWRPYAGTEDVLKDLAASGILLAVVSNFDSRLRSVLEDLDLAGHFHATVISSEVGCAKPSGKIYSAALEELGVAPGMAVFVGDRLEEDVRGPQRAGLQAFQIRRDGKGEGEGVIRHLGQLVTRLI